MSSGEEFEPVPQVDEILKQRKRKGQVQYLVRWRGFSGLYDSWEPASALAHCAAAIKSFLKKEKLERSLSRSRSRSRGRAKSKSRSRSGGRRQPKSESRSRSKSASRKVKESSSKAVRSSTEVMKDETPVKVVESANPEKKGRSHMVKSEESTSKTEVVTAKSNTRQEGYSVEKKTEVVKETVETVKSTPLTSITTTMTSRQRLAVREVQNDQKPQQKSSSVEEKEDTWLWWFADHAVLVLFIIISIVALSFTIENVVDLKSLQFIPSVSTLQDRLQEIYTHSKEEMVHLFNRFLEFLPAWKWNNDDGPAASPKSAST